MSMCRRTTVGNRRKVLISDQAGKANLLAELDRIGLAVNKDDPRLVRLLDTVKEREAMGYAYEAADASFELLARRVLGTVPGYFTVEKFDVSVEHRFNALGEPIVVSMAVVKVKVGEETLISAAEGIGPVNALDVALRKDLGKYQKYIDGLKLTDYRVRILNAGTEAVTRVLIESEDENGDSWSTVGVSPNIIDASFQALMDSIVYKLVQGRRSRHDRSCLHRRARSCVRRTLLRGRARHARLPATARPGGDCRLRQDLSGVLAQCRARTLRQPTTTACMSACERLRLRRSTPFMRRRLQPVATSTACRVCGREYKIAITPPSSAIRKATGSRR